MLPFLVVWLSLQAFTSATTLPSKRQDLHSCNTYTITQKDLCYTVADGLNITAEDLIAWNAPKINSGCTNLVEGHEICVTKPDRPEPVFNATAVIEEATKATKHLDSRQLRHRDGYVESCNDGAAALTFDDGPYVYGYELVGRLSNDFGHRIPATMFVNGYNWGCIYDQPNVDSLRNAVDNGFVIGSHTWSHPDINQISIEALGRQLDFVEEALWKILGFIPSLFRPPYGNIDQERLRYLNSRGYTVVGWNIDSRDASGASAEASRKTISSEFAQNAIVLMHEVKKTTVRNLIPQVMPDIANRNIPFQTIDQCLGVEAYRARGPRQQRDASWTCEGKPAPGQAW